MAVTTGRYSLRRDDTFSEKIQENETSVPFLHCHSIDITDSTNKVYIFLKLDLHWAHSSVRPVYTLHGRSSVYPVYTLVYTVLSSGVSFLLRLLHGQFSADPPPYFLNGIYLRVKWHSIRVGGTRQVPNISGDHKGTLSILDK